MIKAFPKIFGIGDDRIAKLFDGEVEVTEKVDGSMFCFGKIEGQLYMRSKGKQIFPEAPDKMFQKAVDVILALETQALIPENLIFFGEYLQNPRHNALKYDRTPQNHIILFGVSTSGNTFFEYDTILKWGLTLGLEVVPLLYKGRVATINQLKSLLDTDSILGGTKVEGIVVKNYAQEYLLGGEPISIMMGKFVSGKFKEVHNKNWNKEKTDKGKWEQFKEQFCSKVRWSKVALHLKESGELENSPRDIGKLIAAIKQDIIEEELDNIKSGLWNIFGDELLRAAIVGCPEWYKQQLLERVFDNEQAISH